MTARGVVKWIAAVLVLAMACAAWANQPSEATRFTAPGEDAASRSPLVGSIVAWGFNDQEQCDVPDPNSDFLMVGGGGGHTLGLKVDGFVEAWGRNNYGECDVPPPNSGFVFVDGGAQFSAGVKSDGSIAAWGRNGSGQCDVPDPNESYVGVAAGGGGGDGGGHTLGLKSDGSIVAWGNNYYGQCDVPSPNTDFVAVAAGYWHSLGLKSDGSIVAWGRNHYGQCDVPSPNTDFVAIAAGGGGMLGCGFSLGLKSDGSIVPWGSNTFGETTVETPNADFVAVAAGYYHSLGLKANGSIAGWGNDDYGQCEVPPPNTDFVGVAAGGVHSLGLRHAITTWHVDLANTSGTETGSELWPFDTIQEGLDAASTGDTVLVAPGTYMGDGNRGLDYGGEDIVLNSTAGSSLTVIDCEGADRGFYFHSNETASAIVNGFTVTRGFAYVGGAVHCDPASPTFQNCVFIDNHASDDGGAVQCMYGSAPSFADCSFIDNRSDDDGGGFHCWGTDVTMDRCLFSGNTASDHGGGAVVGDESTGDFQFCTFYANVGGGGGVSGVSVHGGSYLDLRNSIIAGGQTGVALRCNNDGVATLLCCDVWGNVDGDWVGCLETQFGVSGNVSEDPLFCDAAGGVFTVSTDSPCASWGNSVCGQIGAFGVGCEAEVPVITTITDVGNDQGRGVRIHWLRSMYDAAGDTVDVDAYGVYRRQDEYLKVAPEGPATAADVVAEHGGARLDGWDFIDTVPARGDEAYQFVAPTLCDSTEQGGICWSVFMVSAMTPDGMVYYDSRPDSGYSLDNLAPAAPAAARGEFDPGVGDITISWSPTESEDLAYYEVFRGQGCDFEPPAGTWIGDTAETLLVDSSLDWDDGSCYKVAAVDFAGNRSEYVGVWAYETGVPDDGELDKAVVQNSPNPFSPAGGPTEIQYSVPASGGAVRIAVYDLSGHLIRELVDQDMPAGTHSVFWNGTDTHGRSVAAGVYFYRVDAPGIAEKRKMIVLK